MTPTELQAKCATCACVAACKWRFIGGFAFWRLCHDSPQVRQVRKVLSHAEMQRALRKLAKFKKGKWRK